MQRLSFPASHCPFSPHDPSSRDDNTTPALQIDTIQIDIDVPEDDSIFFVFFNIPPESATLPRSQHRSNAGDRLTTSKLYNCICQVYAVLIAK